VEGIRRDLFQGTITQGVGGAEENHKSSEKLHGLLVEM
jgi:hypothetical protein